MNKKFFFVLFAVLMMAVMTVSVSADQLANDRWCNIDQYGCWVTGDEGNQIYIMFWSEEARQFFMGGSTAPYKDVQNYCTDCTEGKLFLGKSIENKMPEAPEWFVEYCSTVRNGWVTYEDGDWWCYWN